MNEIQVSKADRLLAAFAFESHDIEQALGKVLGFPWYRDDQKNFPGTTGADGVCVGPYTSVVLAEMAAEEVFRLRSALEGLMPFADRVMYSFNGDLSRHQRWELAVSAARAALENKHE